MTDAVEIHLRAIEKIALKRGSYSQLQKLAALHRLIDAIRTAPTEQQETLAKFTAERLLPLVPDLPDLYEAAADMITHVVEADDEPAITPLSLLANRAPSVLHIDGILLALGASERARLARLH